MHKEFNVPRLNYIMTLIFNHISMGSYIYICK